MHWPGSDDPGLSYSGTGRHSDQFPRISLRVYSGLQACGFLFVIILSIISLDALGKGAIPLILGDTPTPLFFLKVLLGAGFGESCLQNTYSKRVRGKIRETQRLGDRKSTRLNSSHR